MKLYDDNKKKIALLENGDTLIVKTLKGNDIDITIQCIDGCLVVDEVYSKRIKEISMEQKEQQKLEKYNSNKKKDSYFN